MLTVAPKPLERPAGPQCYRCGTDTQLFGIESHPTIALADLHTYVCAQCDGLQTEVVPLRRRAT
jgi:hypothetical protein